MQAAVKRQQTALAVYVKFAQHVVKQQHGVLAYYVLEYHKLAQFKRKGGSALLSLTAEIAHVDVVYFQYYVVALTTRRGVTCGEVTFGASLQLVEVILCYFFRRFAFDRRSVLEAQRFLAVGQFFVATACVVFQFFAKTATFDYYLRALLGNLFVPHKQHLVRFVKGRGGF